MKTHLFLMYCQQGTGLWVPKGQKESPELYSLVADQLKGKIHTHTVSISKML